MYGGRAPTGELYNKVCMYVLFINRDNPKIFIYISTDKFLFLIYK